MIDFPTLFPNLVKYLPNWMERFYPHMAQFARGEGYPCGNKGVFIPRRNNCWTHPKTGNRLTKPLTYQKYQEAKEKSQKSRTEAGRTALQNREQGFRDKAREKVKGWQNKRVEDSVADSKLASTWDNLDDRYKIELLNESGLKVKALERKKYREGNLDNTLSLIQDLKVKESLTKLLKDPKYEGEFYRKDRPHMEKKQAKSALEIDRERYKDISDEDIKKEVKALRKRASKLFEQGKDQMSGGKRSTQKAVAGHGGWMLNNTANDLEDLLADRKSQQKPQSEPKPTPNSTGVKGAGGKSVDQQYKDIIAKSKDPVETEKALGEALLGGSLWNAQKREYDRDISDLRDGKVKKGYETYTQGNVNKYKPIVDNEKFIEERRKAIDSGDFQTKKEVEIYLHKKIQAKNNKPYDYFDSPEYEKEYEKVNGILENKELPPPLAGKIPGKDLKQSVKPGDKLLVKETTYGFTDNKPTGHRISSGGEIVKVGIKNIKVRSKGDYMGKPYDHEGLVSMSDVSHVIRDGKRYKVDDSDNSPNDLGIPESVKPIRKRVKKNDFNSNLILANFANTNMRRRELKLANFASYPCGNKGVFIPSSKNCYTHPKTGNKTASANLRLAKFSKPGCCCEASKPLKRRKTKQTPRLKRRGNRYA